MLTDEIVDAAMAAHATATGSSRERMRAALAAANSIGPLTLGEEAIMLECFRATMLRAATIIDGITNADVEEAQAIMFAANVPIGKVAKIDRAMVAASYLRACAAGMADDPKTRIAELRMAANA